MQSSNSPGFATFQRCRVILRPLCLSCPSLALQQCHAGRLKMRVVIRFLLVLLASVPFVGLPLVQGRDVHAQIDASLLHCTYHGPLSVGSQPTPALLHVLVKAKRQADGTFLLRTVSYIERADYRGNVGLLARASPTGRATAKSLNLAAYLCRWARLFTSPRQARDFRAAPRC